MARWSTSVWVLVACVACGSSSPTQPVNGNVRLSGLEDNSGVFVFVSGRGVAEDSFVTQASGAWSFNVPSNFRVFVSSYAPSTKEGLLEAYVDVGGGPATVPDFVFTPVGSLSGTVSVAGGNAEGVTVAIEGTDLTATTDASGRYALTGVPAATYTLRVTAPGRPSVTVKDQVVAYKQTTTVAPISL